MKKLVISFVLICTVLLFALCGCGSDTSGAVDMQQLYTSFEEYLPQMLVLDESSMLNLYGVDAENCNQVVIATCSDGLRSDEVWLIEAVDETSAKEIFELANNRLEREKEETKNYSPEQYAVVEKAQIIADGNNVVMIISPDVDALVEIYTAAAEK